MKVGKETTLDNYPQWKKKQYFHLRFVTSYATEIRVGFLHGTKG